MPIATRPIPPLSEEDKARFWAKVDKNGPLMPGQTERCWVWTAYIDPQGYGKFRLGGDAVKVARVALTLAGKLLTADKPQANHRCGNRSCCNPDHLYAGSQRDNMLDRLTDGTAPRGDMHYARRHPEAMPRGEKHKSTKLSDDQCDYIRSSLLSGVALAEELKVGTSTISRIRRKEARVRTAVAPSPISNAC